MKENSIEEDIKNINKGLYELADSYELYHASWAKRIFESIKEKLNHILSDYKRALKENEEWDRKFCNLQNLYFKLQDESESKRKEYQETYKDVRKELKEWQEAYKSEKKMKNEYVKLYQDLLLKENVIPVQKVKDKIEELQKSPLKINENNKYYYETEAYNKIIIQVLQELLKESEN